MDKQSLVKKIDQLKTEASRIKREMSFYSAQEQAIKTRLSSVYGASGSVYHIMYDPTVAASITAQGRHTIQMMEKVNDHYWKNKWHLDVDAHNMLNIANVEPIPSDVPTTLYAVTDSLFIYMKPILDSCDWEQSYATEFDFIWTIHDKLLSKIFGKALERLSEKQNTKCLLEFDFEYAGHLLLKGKNAYISNVRLDDTGKHTNETIYAGVDIIKKSTPEFARTTLIDIVEQLFDHDIEHGDESIDAMVQMLKTAKKTMQFSIPDRMDTICPSIKINSYAHYVTSDSGDAPIFEKNAPYHVKAAAYYNNELKKNPRLLTKYPLLGDGSEMRYYHAKNTQGDPFVFGYPPGRFPLQIAPDIDLDTHFYKVVLTTANTLIEAMGLPKLNDKLSVFASILQSAATSTNTQTSDDIFDNADINNLNWQL